MLTNVLHGQVLEKSKKLPQLCIIFGFHLSGEIYEVLKFCILIAKYYIHNKRLLDDNNIEFLHFLYVFKFKLDIEHQIYKMNNTTQTFNKFVFLMTKCDTNIYLSWNKVVYYKKENKSLTSTFRTCIVRPLLHCKGLFGRIKDALHVTSV